MISRAAADDSGTLSETQAAQTLAAAHGTTLAPATPTVVDGQLVQPQISNSAAEELNVAGNLTSVTVGQQAADGFTVNSAAGPITLSPLNTNLTAGSGTLINGSSVLYPNAWTSTDLVTRPNALGASSWLDIRGADAPMSYSWNIDIDPTMGLTQLPDGAIAITDNNDAAPQPDDSALLALDPLFGQGDTAALDDTDITTPGSGGDNEVTTTTDSTDSPTISSVTTTTDTTASVELSTASSDSSAAPVDTTTTTDSSGPTETTSNSSVTGSATTTATTTDIPAATSSSTTTDTTTTGTDTTSSDGDAAAAAAANAPDSPLPQQTLTVGAATPNDPNPENTGAQEAAGAAELTTATADTNGSAVMVIEPPTAIDSDGNAVPVTMTVDPNTDTLSVTVTPTAQTAYPIAVDPNVVSQTDAAAALNPKASYGLSSQYPNIFWNYNPFEQNVGTGGRAPNGGEGLDPYLNERMGYNPTTQTGGAKYARAVVGLACADIIDDAKYGTITHLTDWISAVQAAHLTPILTFQNPDNACPPTPATPKLTAANPGTADDEYFNSVRDIMTITCPLGVKLYGAWNEPDLPNGGNNVPAPAAAKYWVLANQAAQAAGCSGYTISAGEFSSYRGSDVTTYVPNYVSHLVADARAAKLALPHAWGFHDYGDLSRGNAGSLAPSDPNGTPETVARTSSHSNWRSTTT